MEPLDVLKISVNLNSLFKSEADVGVNIAGGPLLTQEEHTKVNEHIQALSELLVKGLVRRIREGADHEE